MILLYFFTDNKYTKGNAFFSFTESGLLRKYKPTSASPVDRLIGTGGAQYCLAPEYSDGVRLRELVDHIGKLRQSAVVARGAVVNALVADFPVLARL